MINLELKAHQAPALLVNKRVFGIEYHFIMEDKEGAIQLQLNCYSNADCFKHN